jgi:BirA family biotin operon repressor/biotin-[acetyl-CoA-carboxylase] ligase
MHLIKLSATDSTNAHLKRMVEKEGLSDGTVLWAETQTHGRGQPGTQWESEAGKNLTFSILKSFSALQARDHFAINMLVSSSISALLSEVGVPKVSVKWPNDILSGGHKICGILPENVLQGTRIIRSVIGIGLNVNQTNFPNFPRASSMKSVCGRAFELETLLLSLIAALQTRFNAENALDYTLERNTYESMMFLKDKTATFSTGAALFPGIIRGVDREGRLRLETEAEGIQSFGFKTIQMHY